MVDHDARLQAVIERLEACQADLSFPADRETVHLIAMAILQLRMRVHKIDASELQALCDEIISDPKIEVVSKIRGSA